MDNKSAIRVKIYSHYWLIFTFILLNLIIQIIGILILTPSTTHANLLVFFLVISDCVICYLVVNKIIYPYYHFHIAINELITNDTIDSIPDIYISDSLPETTAIYDSILSYKKETRQLYAIELLKNQAELNALQSQINPHFLYNTIDAIRSQVLIAGESEVADILENLSNFFRYSIGSSTTLISIREELGSIDGYIKIMQFRFPQKFTLIKRIDIDDDLIMDYQIPKLTLQPLIENAITHGLEMKPGSGIITLRLSRTSKYLQLSVEDNGIGIDPATLDKLNHKLANQSTNQVMENRAGRKNKTGIGLVNVNHRIKLIFGQDYGLNVTSIKNKSSCINILLPIEQDKVNNGKYRNITL